MTPRRLTLGSTGHGHALPLLMKLRSSDVPVPVNLSRYAPMRHLRRLILLPGLLGFGGGVLLSIAGDAWEFFRTPHFEGLFGDTERTLSGWLSLQDNILGFHVLVGLFGAFILISASFLWYWSSARA